MIKNAIIALLGNVEGCQGCLCRTKGAYYLFMV